MVAIVRARLPAPARALPVTDTRGAPVHGNAVAGPLSPTQPHSAPADTYTRLAWGCRAGRLAPGSRGAADRHLQVHRGGSGPAARPHQRGGRRQGGLGCAAPPAFHLPPGRLLDFWAHCAHSLLRAHTCSLPLRYIAKPSFPSPARWLPPPPPPPPHPPHPLGCLQAARLEEDFQLEDWGMVEAGHDLDIADAHTRIAAPAVLVGLLGMQSQQPPQR